MLTKSDLRTELRRRRTALSEADRTRAADALTAHVRHNPFGWTTGTVVAAYVPAGTEPGSLGFLDALVDLGVTVLLPVVPEGDPAPLNWVHYTGPDGLERRRWGLLEPVGAGVGTSAVADAAALLIPALAIGANGARLGRGAGYYDRTIAHTRADKIGIVYDHELLDDVPADGHDVPMGWALTPSRGFLALPTPT